MRGRLKRLQDQVLVITGASSGINLVAARNAAAQGARVLLVSRNERAMREICEGIAARGGLASYAIADVGVERDVEAAAEAALQRYGRIDTWVNGAAVSIYGRVLEVSLEDQRRLFETNYWGMVHGSRVAARYLRRHGGALINIGSVLSDRAIPVQGVYSASKHAVKGFTDALRMDIEAERLPISVTLIKPSAIDTPYMRYAKNYLDVQPKNPPPIYAPELAADAILYAAQHPVRDIVVGGGGRLISLLGMLFPRLTDIGMRWSMPYLQRTKEPARPREQNNLYHPDHDGQERSAIPDLHVFERSLYTRARLNPVKTAALAVAIGGAALLALRRR
ncbi:MAG TPA: SDR family oxidoreductase [Burkholderiales bacterium]|nr:SDR family oxidoreductase [Burkholderiales bacterium]